MRAGLCALLLMSVAWTAALADLSAADVTKSLETIKTHADAVAAGHDKTQSQLREAARIIGVEWEKVEPAVAKDFLVETRFANQSIAAFERDWRNESKARSDAKDVSAKVAQLLNVHRQSATPAPSGQPSGSPSPEPSGSAAPTSSPPPAPTRSP